MTTAFVLSGGGSLGAVQVGMLRAITDAGVQPDLLLGTSAGAVNAAFVSGHGTSRKSLADLASIWQGLRRRDVFPIRPGGAALAVLGRRASLCSNDALRDLVAAHLPFRRLEDAPIPLHVVATHALSGDEVLLSTGDAVDAVLASAAIPAVFPPVEIDGVPYVDGGIANNAAISHAVGLGADRVVVIPTGFACALERAPKSMLGAALHALTLLIEQRLILEVAHFAGLVDLTVLPPLCPLSVSSTDFRHGAELIERAHRATTEWLDAGGPALPRPHRFLSLHHDRGVHEDAHVCHVATFEGATPQDKEEVLA